MKIKPLNQERRPVDVSEWNDEVKAYFKPLSGFETLVFNDYFLEFYNKENSTEDRFKAGFKAAVMALVGEDGAPLLDETDEEAVRAASFLPIMRVFTVGLSFRDEASGTQETQATSGSDNSQARAEAREARPAEGAKKN
ncbi:MAG: hypothetical protein PHO46_11510 [Thermoguttaceae bacterium]|jgi:hypothetical protein|nr:hypothetical protein [Thermoguttaceae bacterium]